MKFDKTNVSAIFSCNSILWITMWILLNSVIVGSAGDAAIGVDNNGINSDQKMTKERFDLWRLIHSCSHKVTLNAAGKLEIGIGVFSKSGTFTPREFTWDELEQFYKNQPDKKIVALVIDPSPEEITKRRIATIVKSFKNLGYIRVVVVQNTGSGYHLIRDTKK